MKNVEFKKDGWFTKFYKFSVGLKSYDTPTKNGCEFFWTSLFSIILLPFTWWNLIIDKVSNDPPDNLIMRTISGVGCYIGYLLLSVIGWGFFVSGVDSDGKAYTLLIDLFNEETISTMATLVFLPLLGAISVALIIGTIVGFFYLIGLIIKLFDTKYEEIKVKDEEGNFTHYSRVEKSNVFVSFKNLVSGIYEKYCPIIEWK